MQTGAGPRAIETDSFFACLTEATRAALARYVPVYGYEFAKENPASNFLLPQGKDIALGDSHTTELAYVFGHDGTGAPLPEGPDRSLSDAIIRYWTNHAASGNPNRTTAPRGASDEGAGQSVGRQGGTRWLAYRAGSSRVLSLADPIARETGFDEAHHCALWASLDYPQRLITALAPAQ